MSVFYKKVHELVLSGITTGLYLNFKPQWCQNGRIWTKIIQTTLRLDPLCNIKPSNIFVGEKCGQTDTTTSPQRFILESLYSEQIMENHIRLLPLFGLDLCS